MTTRTFWTIERFKEEAEDARSIIAVFESGWEPRYIDCEYDARDGVYLPPCSWWDPIIELYDAYVHLKIKEEEITLHYGYDFD